MPATLALIICSVFVLFLLRLEHKQTPNVSKAVWIPAIWMLYIASRPLAAWFFPSGGWTVEAGSPVDRFFLSGLFLLAIFILISRKFNWSRSMREQTFVIFLVGLMLVSVVWSDFQLMSFKRWFRELIAIVMGFMVLSEHNPRQAVQSVFRRNAYILIPFSILLIKYYPEYGVEFAPWSGAQMWVGVTTQKNGLGRLCIISAFFLIWALYKRWGVRKSPLDKLQNYTEIFVLFLTCWLLKGPPGAYSATSITVLAIGLAFFFSLLWFKKLQISLGVNSLTTLMAIIIGYGIATPFIGQLPFVDISSSLGRDGTLTGRTDIWEILIPMAMQSPILGSGVGGFWTTETREIISGAHNGYLEVILHFGFVGLLFYSLFLLSSYRNAHNRLNQDFDWASLHMSFLFMIVIYNIPEATISTFTSHLTAVFLFLKFTSTSANLST